MLPEVPQPPEEATVLQRVHLALADFWAFDRLLVERRLGRRTIAHRLAVYLERQFPGFHTDCEYSRNSRVDHMVYTFPHMSRPRRRDLIRQGLTEQEAEAVTQVGEGAHPDIIVHVRERGDLNVLVVEVRLADDPRGWGGEREATEKLGRYTLQGEEGLFRYAVGLFVELGVTDGGEDHSVIRQFRDGREVE